MGDRHTDHLHRNIAKLTEFLSEHDIKVVGIDTAEDTWESDKVEFTIIVPQFDPIEIDDDNC